VDALTRLALIARTGDHRALDQLVEGTYELVWRFCARIVDQQSADDLAQESFLRAVAALPAFRADASVRTWILSIARNVCMDELRSRSRQRRRDASLANDAHTSRGGPPNADGQVVMTDLLARLTPERRESFVLTHLLGFSYQATADVCARPIGTIRSQVARARMDLLAALEESDRSGDPSVVERSDGPLPSEERRTS
jgi:RNA polymerase sigma-70 factor (ECF subfamily)